MDRKQVDKLLVKADKALKFKEIKIVKENQISGIFVAYTAAFGTAVIQNGLLPALAFFCSKSEDKIERNKIVQTIAYMLTGNENEKQFLSTCVELQKDKLKYKKQTKDVVNASVALKMMMRTYKLIKNEDSK